MKNKEMDGEMEGTGREKLLYRRTMTVMKGVAAMLTLLALTE